MDTLIRTAKWAWKAWPLWMLLFVGTLHFAAYHYFLEDTDSVNKTVALTCQLIGGLLVLISIDSNLGILKKENIWGALLGYLVDPEIHITQ